MRGYSKLRRLVMPCGTMEARRRSGNPEERIHSRILPLIQRRSRMVNSMLPKLCLHGLAQRVLG